MCCHYCKRFSYYIIPIGKVNESFTSTDANQNEVIEQSSLLKGMNSSNF